ncbi:MAG: tRNA (adenosine(37)-N6)-threonylcarbamoyltransferase complex dimerization subunit type 1 TsaB [Clostridia bacterium]|nr:tRNA (adenosine(37)-N6)-threonylcarbamoyltransferase complex dimerization subunit type 1 TsaB [Clostridia bacterium]
MIILAFDSTAKAASVAVCDGEKLLANYNIDNGLTQSELLLPMAENMLASLKLTFDDVELLACSVGPGSFTGVRIGVALVKGIAFGKNIPCVSVSTLDELAENLKGLEGIIVPCMDARRNQVYTATYRGKDGELEKLTEDRAIAITELAEELGEYGDTPIYLSGDGYDVAKRGLESAGIKVANTPKLLITENAYSVALIAKRKYEAGEYGTDLEIAPTYLRMPQAERERLERLAKEKEEQNKE